MKYLGIDYGTKRTGIALSDEEGAMAFPRMVIETSKTLVQDIVTLMQNEQAEIVVLGQSLDLLGKPNAVMEHIEKLKNALEAQGVTVYFEKEFYSSQQAARIQGENDMHDASAAAIILQSYLDKQDRNQKMVDSDPYASV